MKKTPLSLWIMPNAGYGTRELMDRELARFARTSGGFPVKYDILSWPAAWERIIACFKARSGPDVIQVGSTWVGTLGHLGAVHVLPDSLSDASRFNPALINACRISGHVWAVPWFCDSRVLYYRADMLKSFGIDPVSLQTEQGFDEACSYIRKRTRTAPLGFSGQKTQTLLHDIAAFVWCAGGRFLNDDGTRSDLDRSETLAGLTRFAALIRQNIINRGSLERSSGEVVHDFFAGGRHVFIYSNSWPRIVYLDANSPDYIGRERAAQYGAAPFPRGQAGSYNFLGGSALAVTGFSPRVPAAQRLIQYLTGPSVMRRHCEAVGMFPARLDVKLLHRQMPRFADIFDESLLVRGRSYPAHPLWGSVEQVLVNGLALAASDYARRPARRAAYLNDVHEISREVNTILSMFG